MMWLDGFSYSFVDGAPTKAQYYTIVEKLRQIDNYYVKPAYRSTDPIFRDGPSVPGFDYFTITADTPKYDARDNTEYTILSK